MGAGQPVIQGGFRSDARPGAETSHDPGRENLLDVPQRAVKGDLGQHRGQAPDACLQRVAILGRSHLPPLLPHRCR